MTSDDYKKIFDPIIADLRLLCPYENSSNYYTGCYDVLGYLLPLINDLKRDYLSKNISRKEFYKYLNDVGVKTPLNI